MTPGRVLFRIFPGVILRVILRLMLSLTPVALSLRIVNTCATTISDHKDDEMCQGGRWDVAEIV